MNFTIESDSHVIEVSGITNAQTNRKTINLKPKAKQPAIKVYELETGAWSIIEELAQNSLIEEEERLPLSYAFMGNCFSISFLAQKR